MVAAKSRSFHIFHGLEIPREKKKKKKTTGWYETRNILEILWRQYG